MQEGISARLHSRESKEMFVQNHLPSACTVPDTEVPMTRRTEGRKLAIFGIISGKTQRWSDASSWDLRESSTIRKEGVVRERFECKSAKKSLKIQTIPDSMDFQV